MNGLTRNSSRHDPEEARSCPAPSAPALLYWKRETEGRCELNEGTHKNVAPLFAYYEAMVMILSEVISYRMKITKITLGEFYGLKMNRTLIKWPKVFDKNVVPTTYHKETPSSPQSVPTVRTCRYEGVLRVDSQNIGGCLTDDTT